MNIEACRVPLLIDEVGQGAPAMLATTLRCDPCPLSGLFQQLVVLVRCVSLYDRFLQYGAFDIFERQVLEVRGDVLRGQADQALATIQSQADALTGYGQDLVTQAGDLLGQARSIPQRDRQPVQVSAEAVPDSSRTDVQVFAPFTHCRRWYSDGWRCDRPPSATLTPAAGRRW